MVELLKATEDDLEELHSLQVEAFMPLYEKYHDDEMSPAKESIERIAKKLSRPHSFFYFVTSEGEKVGVIRIVRDYESADDSIMHISPLFIRPRFQGMGFGGAAIEAAFELWDKTTTWRLATIKEEPKNCYLYEKYGFVRTGWEQKINDLMTIVGYERKETEHA